MHAKIGRSVRDDNMSSYAASARLTNQTGPTSNPAMRTTGTSMALAFVPTSAFDTTRHDGWRACQASQSRAAANDAARALGPPRMAATASAANVAVPPESSKASTVSPSISIWILGSLRVGGFLSVIGIVRARDPLTGGAPLA